MSSLIRRLQKGIAKGQGYSRDKKTGKIVHRDGTVVGPHWPQVSAPTRK